MITEKDTIKCEAIFNDSHTHRYLWRRVWDKDKPTIAIIMLNPCQADSIVTDTTTSLVVNNVAKLQEYGGVEILNLYSKLTTKLSFKETDEELNDKENDSYILKSVESSSKTILAWGKASNSNVRIEERATQVVELLKKHQEKLYMISDGTRVGLHPLTPSIRSKWILEKYKLEKQTKK